MAKRTAADEIARDCLMGRSRLMTRVLTGMYDEELRPFGLKATQLTLLVVVAKVGPVRRTEIGKMIHLDPSTLTRNLQVMLSNGWIEEIFDDEDGRGLPLQTSKRGNEMLQDVLPAWRRAQAKASNLLGLDAGDWLKRMSSELSSTQ